MCSIFCLFHQHLCSIYLFSNLVEEPLAVTNILVAKLKTMAGTDLLINLATLFLGIIKTEIQIN
jgi:hypothetical protein